MRVLTSNELALVSGGIELQPGQTPPSAGPSGAAMPQPASGPGYGALVHDCFSNNVLRSVVEGALFGAGGGAIGGVEMGVAGGPAGMVAGGFLGMVTGGTFGAFDSMVHTAATCALIPSLPAPMQNSAPAHN